MPGTRLGGGARAAHTLRAGHLVGKPQLNREYCQRRPRPLGSASTRSFSPALGSVGSGQFGGLGVKLRLLRLLFAGFGMTSVVARWVPYNLGLNTRPRTSFQVINVLTDTQRPR